MNRDSDGGSDHIVWALLVNDQPLIRTGFKTILETEPGIEVADKADDGTRNVELTLELRPDVVCMDMQMSQMDGVEAARELTSRECGSAMLILTAFSRDNFLFETLQAGASGFPLKTAEAEKLIETVQVLGRGEGLLSPQITHWVIECFTALRQEPHCPGRIAARVSAEHEHDALLHLVRGLNNAEIAAEMFVSPEIVKIHMSNILTKLGLRDRISTVIWAYKSGLVPRSS